MYTIAFMRTGQVLRLGASVFKASSVGDQRDAAGLLEYLCTKYRVVVFGQTRDTEEFKTKHPNADVHFIRPDVTQVDGLSSEKGMIAACGDSIEELRSFEPRVCVNVCGASATCTWPGNPRGVFTQCWIAKYVAPAVHAMQFLKLKRICTNNDPRNYPKEAEMSYGWEHVRPVAMLTQETRTFNRTTWNKNYLIHARYARAENWWSYGLSYAPIDCDRPMTCTAIAHSHMNDGRLKKGRNEAWETILKNFKDVDVFGKGWETFSQDDHFHGAIRPGKVDKLLRRTVCGPIVPCADGFATGKLRVYVLAGAAPLLYGRGEYLTYDRDERYVSLDDPFRITDDLERAIELCHDETLRKEYVTRLRRLSEPDFTLLDECIEHFINDGEEDYEKYGGYQRT